jgi:hypothetical protein
MSVTVTIPATSTHLTTMSAVKATLGVSSIKFDAVLEQLIGAASSAIEEYVQHVYARQTYIETVNGSAHPMLMLTNVPIVSITSIICDSSPIEDYSIQDPDGGILYRAAGWIMSAWVGWGVSDQPPQQGTGERIYTVTYEAGYITPGLTDSNLPPHIEQACIETVVDWYRSSKRDSQVKSKKVGDLSISYKSAAAGEISSNERLPAGARALLSRRFK